VHLDRDPKSVGIELELADRVDAVVPCQHHLHGSLQFAVHVMNPVTSHKHPVCEDSLVQPGVAWMTRVGYRLLLK
jgi:hypothetical protein